jgi:hypothetical protein
MFQGPELYKQPRACLGLHGDARNPCCHDLLLVLPYPSPRYSDLCRMRRHAANLLAALRTP